MLTISINICPGKVFFGTAEGFLTRLDMVVYHHKPECTAKMVAFFNVKVTVRAYNYNQNMTS